MEKIVFSVLSFALIGLIVIRIFFVNTAAIQQQIEYYEKDEEVKLDGCFINIVDENTTGYSITVHSGKLTTFGEFAKKYKGNTEPSAYELTSESKIIELDVSIKNEGNSDGYIFLEARDYKVKMTNGFRVWNYGIWSLSKPQEVSTLL